MPLPRTFPVHYVAKDALLHEGTLSLVHHGGRVEARLTRVNNITTTEASFTKSEALDDRHVRRMLTNIKWTLASSL